MGTREKEVTVEDSFTTETGSQVADPMPSWVADSQAVEPPAKLQRLGEKEVVSEERVLGAVEEVFSEGCEDNLEGSHPDLRSAIGFVAPIPQAKCTPTVPYPQKKKVLTTTATRKSARGKGAIAAIPIMEKA
jgi:hypothetical protein